MYASVNNAEIFRNTQNFLAEVDLNSSERRYPLVFPPLTVCSWLTHAKMEWIFELNTSDLETRRLV